MEKGGIRWKTIGWIFMALWLPGVAQTQSHPAPLEALRDQSPRCPSPILPPNQVQIGTVALRVDYKRIMEKKDNLYSARYTEANEEFVAWLKKKYGLTLEELADPNIRKRRWKKPDLELVTRQKDSLVQTKYAEAEQEFNAWLKSQYDITAAEFDAAVSAYYEEETRRYRKDLLERHLSEDQCPPDVPRSFPASGGSK